MDAKSLFEILIRENTDMLVAYIRAGVRDEHGVDDLYQETVLTAWKRLDDCPHYSSTRQLRLEAFNCATTVQKRVGVFL